MPEDVIITLRFAPTQSEWAEGEVACNAYSLRLIEATDGRLMFGDGGGVTEMACAEDPTRLQALNELTDRYIGTLHSASQYDVDGDTLRLETEDHKELVFRRGG